MLIVWDCSVSKCLYAMLCARLYVYTIPSKSFITSLHVWSSCFHLCSPSTSLLPLRPLSLCLSCHLPPVGDSAFLSLSFSFLSSMAFCSFCPKSFVLLLFVSSKYWKAMRGPCYLFISSHIIPSSLTLCFPIRKHGFTWKKNLDPTQTFRILKRKYLGARVVIREKDLIILHISLR